MLSFLASCYNGDDIPEKVTTDAMYKALNAMEWPHCHSRGNVRPEDEAYIVAAPVGLINLYLMGVCLFRIYKSKPQYDEDAARAFQANEAVR